MGVNNKYDFIHAGKKYIRAIKKRVFIFSLLFLQLGLCYAQMNDSNYIHPTGVLYDAGGHKLHLNIQGSGSPCVIFENGSGDFSFVWSLVQPEIAKITETVS